MTDPAPSLPDDLDIRIVAGSPTDAEVAAVTAVLHATLDELASDEAKRSNESVNAWQRSQRQLRSPLTAGPGAWRGFSG